MKPAIFMILLAAAAFAQSGSSSTWKADLRKSKYFESSDTSRRDNHISPCSGAMRTASDLKEGATTPVEGPSTPAATSTETAVSENPADATAEVKKEGDGKVHLIFPKGTPGVLVNDCEIDDNGKPVRGCRFKITVPTTLTRK